MNNFNPAMMSQNQPQQGQGMPGVSPLEQMPQEGQMQEPTKILAHMSPDEVAGLDEAQAGPIIDPETGLRDYSEVLDPMLKNPEVQDMLAKLFSSKEKPGFAQGGIVNNEQINEPGRPIVPELEELREQGRGDDTELVIITTDLEKLFTEWGGGKVKVNPATGFPEFGWFKEIIRAVGTALGPVTGFVASKATGQSTGAALKNAGIGAALALVPLGMGGAFGPMFGGAGAAGKGFMGMGGSGAGFFGGAGGAGSAAGAGAGGAGGAAGMGGGFLSKLMSPGTILPLAASALMARKGAQDEEKMRNEAERKRKQEEDEMRARMGFHDKANIIKPYELTPNPIGPTQEDIAAGKQHDYFIHKPNYSAGGPIHGMGKGQQDNIPKDVQKNSYIIDASSVSDIGDGSTNAGFRELNNYFSKVPMHHPEHMDKGGKSKGVIKALVSDGEYEVPAEIVTSKGQGSNEKGAKLLEQLIKKVRKQKRTSGDKLPPKSKPLGGYLKQMKSE